MIIILSGAIGRCTGVGGAAWCYMQYLYGLQELGHEVYYLEDCGERSWVYKWETDEFTTDLEYPASYVRDCLDPGGFMNRWIYRAGERSVGMAVDDFLDVCSHASCLIVYANPITPWRAEYDWPLRRVFIDGDPAFTQFSLANGKPDLVDTVGRCESVFTVGQGIGNPDCSIPSVGRHWLKTVPIVSLSYCPVADGDTVSHFTSIMNWRGFRDIEYDGVLYGQKDREFPRFLDVPRHTTQPFLIALMGGPVELLSEHGWEIIAGEIPSRTPWTYRRFIQESRAEFGVAKHGYVTTRSGWFSERSVCYLASGRPILIQDTGQSEWLPTGDGVLTFRDLTDAVEGIELINADYEHHRRAARRLAEEYFAATRVLSLLLEEAMS